MSITDEIVEYVSKLSKPKSEPKEKQKTDMLNYIEIINMLDNKEVEATSKIHPLKNVFKEDKIKYSLSRKDILSNAHDITDDCYNISGTLE